MSDTWYKRNPRDFVDGVQGMGPELIGAYAVILELIYARSGDLPRDDRHLAGVLGCSIRKARALTDGLIEIGKLHLVAGKLTNDRAERVLNERRNQRETGVKPTRNSGEKAIDTNEINGLTQTDKNREEENNITPLTPRKRGGSGRFVGVPEGTLRLLYGDDYGRMS